MAHLSREILELCKTVPVLMLKCLRQSRHRKGAGLRLATVAMLRLPHLGQATPLGQRCSMNHASAFFLRAETAGYF